MLEQHTHELFATRNGILLMSDFIKMTHVLIKCTISSLFTVCAFSSTSFLSVPVAWFQLVRQRKVKTPCFLLLLLLMHNYVSRCCIAAICCYGVFLRFLKLLV